jgi:hypothetical protein
MTQVIYNENDIRYEFNLHSNYVGIVRKDADGDWALVTIEYDKLIKRGHFLLTDNAFNFFKKAYKNKAFF